MSKNFDINMLHFGKVEYNSEYGVFLHKHNDFYQLQYFLEGEAILRIEEDSSFNEYELNNKTLALIKPDCLHGMRKDELESKIYPYFDIKFSVSDRALEQQLNSMPVTIKIEKPTIDTLIRLSKIKENEVLSNAICTALIYELVSESQEQTETVRKGISTPSYLAYKYILENCNKNISLEDVCSAISYNKTYLSAIFKKDFNLTINDFITTNRIKKAEEMLIYSEYGIGGIAKEMDFASVAHFSRVFKEYVGVTPSQYRKTNS